MFMLWKLFFTSFFICSACAVHLKYLEVDSDMELLDVTLDFGDLVKPEEQLPGVCWACKWVMNKVKRSLGQNANVDVIKEQLATVCDSIGFLRGLCKKMISKYLDTLVEELSTTDDPKTICANIGLCKGESMLKFIEDISQNYQNI